MILVSFNEIKYDKVICMLVMRIEKKDSDTANLRII